MHILDLIMYVVLSILLWIAIDKLFNGEFTNELGAIAGFFIMAIFTIIYVILFAFYPDWNWVDLNLSNVLPKIIW